MSNNNYQTSSLHALKKNKKYDMGSYSYTKLSNYLLDEYILEKDLSAFDIVILIRIVRNTLGFQKLSAKISIPQLSKETKFMKPTVVKSLKKLEKLQAIFIERQGTKGNIITINEQILSKSKDSDNQEDTKMEGTNQEIIACSRDEQALVQEIYKPCSRDEQALVQEIYKFPESLKKEKEIYKETTTKKDAQARVVVFSSLEKYEFSEQYKLKICSDYSEKQINLALKRFDRMPNKKNLEACMMACLKNEKIWVDKMSKSEIEEKNLKFLKTLKHFDGKNILSVDIAVGKFYIEFSGGQSIRTFDVKDDSFIDNVKDMLMKLKISVIKGSKIEQIDTSNTEVAAKNLVSK